MRIVAIQIVLDALAQPRNLKMGIAKHPIPIFPVDYFHALSLLVTLAGAPTETGADLCSHFLFSALTDFDARTAF